MTDPSSGAPTPPRAGRAPVKPALSPALRRLVVAVYVTFVILGINALYLVAIRAGELLTGAKYQDYFYQLMFLGHLGVGVVAVLPFLIFGVAHMRRTMHRKVRVAVRSGYALFGCGIALVVSGVLLTRLGDIDLVRSPDARTLVYWIHVLAVVPIALFFLVHRSVGPRLKVKVGLRIAVAGGLVVAGLVGLQVHDPREWDAVGPASGERYFFPSLARTSTGNFIPADVLMKDDYCAECHADAHAAWAYSAHRFSSFNNPFYKFSVRQTREAGLERDGDVRASRFCAGCHDPVVFFSGAFDDPAFDDENHPTAMAGITCTSCHAITNVNSTRGNSDYTIEEPVHYPFAFSENDALRRLSKALVQAKPEFHKRTFLKPIHKTAEFCSTCHKVFLPKELNDYKFLRGQNHYDSFALSGVSGQGVQSFYYPEHAEPDCNGCHMPPQESRDFGAHRIERAADPVGWGKPEGLAIHNHQFAGANTALGSVLDWPEWTQERQKKILEGVLRVDLFGLREERLDGELVAPLRPNLPTVVRGKTYVISIVLRTMKMGHHFTQGTADSNEVWLDVGMRSAGRTMGRSGGLDGDGRVDPWSHFINAYVLDREGGRIDRRNAQDIFTALYDNQIPPGAADVVHYGFTVPSWAGDTVEIDVRALYRKFDTTYVKHVFGAGSKNELPITEIGRDKLVLSVTSDGRPAAIQLPPGSNEVKAEEWMRFNDFGIASFRRFRGGSDLSPLYDAVYAFNEVEKRGRADGPINRALAQLQLKFLPEATESLRVAEAFSPPTKHPWRIAYLKGLVNMANGNFEAAVANFESILEGSKSLHERGFDFSKDYRLLADLARAHFERSKQMRKSEDRKVPLELARDRFLQVIALDAENVVAHHGLSQVLAAMGDDPGAARHIALRDEYTVDGSAQGRAVGVARARNPAASMATQNSFLYPLQRSGAFGGPEPGSIDAPEAAPPGGVVDPPTAPIGSPAGAP